MEIKNLIKVYDDILPLSVLSSYLRFINTLTFEPGKIHLDGEGNQGLDKKIRNTEIFSMWQNFDDNNMTGIHWFNLTLNVIKNFVEQYRKDLNLNSNLSYSRIDAVDILKYQNNGFYTWHVDAGSSINRTLSVVYLFNNDYEGGNLCFKNPDESGEMEIDVKPNRMIIWPSNFLYPHTVKPVTKGTRYSLVSWVV